MKGIAKHSAEFMDATGLKRWHTLELEFDQNSKHPLEALDEVEKLVQQAVTKSNSQGLLNKSITFPEQLPVIQIKPEDREIGVKPEDILSCKDLITLENYRFLLKSDKELERAYILRHDQLTALTSTSDFGEKAERELRLQGKLNNI